MATHSQIKSAILWLFISVGLCMHSVFALDGIFFGVNLQLPDTDGSEPSYMAVMHIVFEVLPLVFALLALFLSSRPFVWVSSVYAWLLCVGNAFHLLSTFGEEPFSLAQIALLSFILAANIMLAIVLWKSLKCPCSKCAKEEQ